MATERQVSILQTLVQSAAIHPEWTVDDHASYLVHDAFCANPAQIGDVAYYVGQAMVNRTFIGEVVEARTWITARVVVGADGIAYPERIR
jgi:hypothetical protein